MKTKERVVFITIVFAMFAGFFASLRILRYLQSVDAEAAIFINVTAGLMTMLGLAVLMLIHSREVVTEKTNARLFGGMIVLTYLGVICDNLSWAANVSARLSTANFILNMGGYLITPILLFLFWNYQNRVFLDEPRHIGKINDIVRAVAIIDILYVILASLSGFLFTIDADGRYVYGNGSLFVYICPLIMVVCSIYENLRRELSLQKKIVLLSFDLVPIISMTFSIPLPQYSLVYLVFFVNLLLIYGTVQVKTERELAEKTARIAEQNRALAEQQTQIMISQMQPHFLYNTLTAIHRLCAKDTALAQKTIQDFSTYLRTNMDSIKNTAPIPFEKELAHTKTYLEIELLRFSSILNVEYDIAVTDFKIPALTLQPIVENAVRYGIRSRVYGGTVTISTRRSNGNIYLTVHDDGMGFDVNEKKNDGRSHLGIENTRNRLRQMMNAELRIDSQIGVGTTVTMILEDKHETVIGG